MPGESDHLYGPVEAARGLRLRLRQLPPLARRAAAHPRWFVETVRGAWLRRREERRRFTLDEFERFFVTPAAAVAAVADVSADEATAAIERRRAAPVARAATTRLAARDDLVAIVGALVELLRPAVMVETGVAEGVSSATALAAMDANGYGHLYSIDLPVLHVSEEEFIGRAVPDALRHRWTLALGPSRLLLPDLVQRVAPLDIFLHDADHTYPSQLEEYRTAWPHLRPNGILLSDDVCNPAFTDFAAEVEARPYLVGARDSAVGLLVKP